MDASSKASSVRLFDDLSWLPLYEEAKISIYLIAFERLRGEMPAYITRLLTRISDLHSRNTRYANYNLVCPKFKRKLDGGKNFQCYHMSTMKQFTYHYTTNDISTKLYKGLRAIYFSETKRV